MIHNQVEEVTSNDRALTMLVETLQVWKGLAEKLTEVQTKQQYVSQIQGAYDRAQLRLKDKQKWPWQRLGMALHNGEAYLVFQFEAKVGTNIKLTGIVKDPRSKEITNASENKALNQAVHLFLFTQSPTHKVELEADTPGLVETYYGYGYKLPPIFGQLQQPDAIVNERWATIVTERQPNLQEREQIASKNRAASILQENFQGGKWKMIKEGE